jgi:chromate transporter
LTTPDLLSMFGHFAVLSLLSIGGALGTSPEMHRYLVDDRGWMNHAQFTDSIALAQAAPGPNILFVTLLGWQAAGAAGALAATAGILLPSSVICVASGRWRTANESSRLVAAIRLGLSPIAIGLTLSAGWVIAVANNIDSGLWVLTVLAFVFFLASKRNPLWLIGLGALAGALGIV